VTIKDRLHKMVDELSEQEADDALEYMVSRRESRSKPADAVDDWGNLSELHRVAFGDQMRRLAEEERAAGHDPW
jgi:superfamily II RNA helicase